MSSPLAVRAAKPEEAQRLSELAFRSKAHWGYSQAFMEACREELTYSAADFESTFFAVVENEGIVGFYALRRESRTVIDLAAMFVKPAAIGRGYGRVLMEHALVRAREMGAHEMSIQGDPNAEGFYLAMGAVRIGEEESHSIPGRMLPLFSISLADEIGSSAKQV